MNRRYIKKKYKSFEFDALKRYLTKELEKEPQNTFLKVLMADVLEGKQQVKKAIEYISEKNSEENVSFYTLFVKARIFQNAERISEAIPIWRMIISADLKDISESLEWAEIKSARTIKNDARYYLSHCLFVQNNDEEALRLAKEHLANRKKGVYSDFSLKEVRKFKRMLEWTMSKPKSMPIKEGSSCTPEQRGRIWSHFEWLKEKDMKLAAKYLMKKGRTYNDEYYMWTVASEIYYELKDASLCLRCAETAYSIIGDNDMQVVYDYASALALNNRFEEALAKFNYILSCNLNFIAYSEHGEGMREAKKLIKKTKNMIELATKESQIMGFK